MVLQYSPNMEHHSHQRTGHYFLVARSGETNDAVSAYTLVKMSDASRLLEIRETECATVWIRPFDIFVRNIGITSMDQFSHWNAIELAIHWKDCYVKEDWKRAYCKKVVEEYPAVNISVFTDKLNSVYQCMSTTLPPHEPPAHHQRLSVRQPLLPHCYEQ